jgi:hypothetical protein
VRTDFRIGFFVGIAAALAIGVYCYQLWQQEHQVLRHTQNLFRRIEEKNWSAVAEMIASDYQDQWNDDRAFVLERIRLVSSYSKHFRINARDVDCKIDNGAGVWRGKIQIESDDAELMAAAKERVNSLAAPFQLEWRHVSRKPWKWKLVRVSNRELEMPGGFE